MIWRAHHIWGAGGHATTPERILERILDDDDTMRAIATTAGRKPFKKKVKDVS